MKLILAIGFWFSFYISSTITHQKYIDDEIFADVSMPLIVHSQNIVQDNDFDYTHCEEYSCWSFIQIIKSLFYSEKDENVPNYLDRKNFFPTFPLEIIMAIETFLDPISVISLTQTCQESHMMFSINYWKNKCQREKLESWGRDISPAKIFITNFWYRSGQLKMIKKAALMGHPESKKIIGNMQLLARSKNQEFSESYIEPRKFYLGGRFSSFRFGYGNLY